MTALRQFVGFALRDAAYRLIDAACRVLNADEAAGIGREGLLTVWDDEGSYVGCLGVETWRELNSLKPCATWTFETQRAWCVEVLDAALRWDTQVSMGQQEGPMPATLATSLSRVRNLVLPA